MTVSWDKLIPHLVHDLRTLVRKGLSSAQLLERKAGEALDVETAGLLRSIIDAQRDLNHLANRIGALAEADRGRVSQELVDLEIVILGAKVPWKNALEEAGGEFTAIGIPVCKVPLQLQAALHELIGNSIRYRHPERRLSIRVEALKTNDTLQISVRDNGSGWNPAYQAKLMEPLERLDAARGGFGLGLAIARALTKSCGGHLHAESDASGSRFVIEMPVPES